MEINQLVILVEKKNRNESFLHKNHVGNEKNKFHLKISISSESLRNLSKVESTKIIYKVLSYEMKNYIHSLQLSIN